jgi:hypothetical protein
VKENICLYCAALAMLLGAAVIPGYANSPASPSRHKSQTQAQTFIGELQGPVENREWVDLILYDQTRKANFYLDDNWKAENYVGHKVKVIGTLDEKNAIIHPESIEELE